MAIKRILQVVVIIVVLVSSFAIPNNTLAWFSCNSYITVQWGDTLGGIASLCGTTVDAIRAANPGLGWWVYAGQVLYIPTGYTYTPTYYPTYNTTYVVQKGDTLGKIAASVGVSIADILAINPQIWNANLIFSGQIINLPTTTAYVATTVYVSDPVYVSQPTYPTAPTYYSDSTLKISYKNGLLVRCDPGGEIIGYATYDEYKKWHYSASSIYRDNKGKVWVQVTLDPPQSGYTVGWILVKDHLGAYFTDPQID